VREARACLRDGHSIVLRAKRDCAAARRFLGQAIGQYDDSEKIILDKSGASVFTWRRRLRALAWG
jgi:transposase-like protein